MRSSAVGPRLECGSRRNPPTPGSAIFPTVIAVRAAAGLPVVYRSGPELPPATQTTIPAAVARSTARERVGAVGRLIAAQAGCPLGGLIVSMPYLARLVIHQSIA